MEIRLDGKTLLVGIAMGIIITVALGVDGKPRVPVPTGEKTTVLSAEATDFGMSVNGGGMVVVRNQNGDFFVVNPKTGMATRVLRSRRLSDEPERANRDNKAKPFNYSVAEADETADGGKGY